MKKTLSVSTFKKEAFEDKKFWRSKTPEERLDALEQLRLQSGNFLYEYPARLSRTIEVVRKAQC
ncbi:MAG: hypothetical protein WC637_04995 [Victivallales bacterium]|jgi:hypothetical protein